jgi:hypothetical protein
MSDVMSGVEIDEQHVELLPARTVLSLATTEGLWDLFGSSGGSGSGGGKGESHSLLDLGSLLRGGSSPSTGKG